MTRQRNGRLEAERIFGKAKLNIKTSKNIPANEPQIIQIRVSNGTDEIVENILSINCENISELFTIISALIANKSGYFVVL